MLGYLALEWAVYLALALYLDNVLPNESGVRRKCAGTLACPACYLMVLLPCNRQGVHD